MAKDRVDRDDEDLVRLYLTDIGQYTLLTKDDEVRLAKAIEAGKEARNRRPNDIFSHILLAMTYIELGNIEDAQASGAEVIRIKPNFTLEWLAKIAPWKNKDDINRMIENLNKAGLPEK